MPDISKKVVVKGIRIGMAQRCADYWMRDPVPGKRSGKVMAEDVGASAVMGLLAVLKQKGVGLAAFKCGPDYIDPLFHRKVLEVES